MSGALLWTILGAMTLAVTAALVVPLLRERVPAGRRVDFDRQVYRHQLGELDADVERGIVTAAEADAARVEIERRLIAEYEGGDLGRGAAAAAPRAVTLGVAFLVPVAALGLYLWLGDPGAATAPEPPPAPMGGEEHRGPTTEGTAAATGMSPEERRRVIRGMVEGLAARLDDEPGDPAPEAAITAFRRVLEIDLENPGALFHVGQVQAEAGAVERARATLQGLLERLDPGGRPATVQY